jgi:cysteine-rich repeat protein
VNQYTTGHQHWPHIGTDATGAVRRHLDQQFATGRQRPGVFARRYDAAGVALGPEFQVNTYTTGSQYQPTVAVAPGGEFAVVWQSAGQDGSGEGIFVQRFDAAGVALGGELAVNTHTEGDQRQPMVAASAARLVTVWESPGQDGSGIDVFGQLYGFCGNGVTDPGEFCDDGNLTDGDGCESTCTPTGCGDGSVTGLEDCDDGNIVSGDCCSGGCTFEPAATACAAGGGCDVGLCDGTGTCVASPVAAGTPCPGGRQLLHARRMRWRGPLHAPRGPPRDLVRERRQRVHDRRLRWRERLRARRRAADRLPRAEPCRAAARST